jgi:hypothetical protein
MEDIEDEKECKKRIFNRSLFSGNKRVCNDPEFKRLEKYFSEH